MKIMKSMIIAAVTATMAFAPQSGMCQKGNPRGIYKLTSVQSSKATVTDCKDQYKVCTDSITLNIVVDNATHWFNFSRNKVYNYTGATPAYQGCSHTMYQTNGVLKNIRQENSPRTEKSSLTQ